MLKRCFIFGFLSLILSLTGYSQNADAVIGKWNTEGNRAVIEIYKVSGKYYGKIIESKEAVGTDGKPITDKKNPNKGFQSRPIINMVILNSFVFKGSNKWEDGTIYDPESGDTYNCEMTLTDKNTLEVRGYVGFSFVGRTVVWKRKI